MKEFYLEIIKVAATAIITPLFIAFFRILAPMKSEFKVVPVDPIEGRKLENKRNFGCLFNFILVAVVLSFANSLIWQPLHQWIHHYPNALYVERLDNIMIYMLCAYLAAPISIITTNYWFIQQYGQDKFNLLQNHYTNMYKFNNLKAEKVLFYVVLIPAIFIIFVLYFPITFITADEVCTKEEFSLEMKKRAIIDVKQIDYIEKVLYNGQEECSGWPNYRITFNDGSKFYSHDINDYTPEDNAKRHKIFQYISQKSGKSITTLNCVTLSEY